MKFEKIETGIRPGEMDISISGVGVGKPHVVLECDHSFKFVRPAHYGRWDLFECTKCGEAKIIYWNKE